MARRWGTFDRRLWEDIADILGEKGVRVELVSQRGYKGNGDPVALPTVEANLVRQTEINLAILTELRKMNFLLEQISGVDVESDAFNGQM